MFELRNISKIVEQDDYERGCLPETTQVIDIDITLQANSLDELVEKSKNYFDGEVSLDFIHESRLDFQVLENGDGYQANEKEIELWKQGKETLYHANYIGTVYEVNRYTPK